MYLKHILTYSILSLVALFGFFGNIHIETQDTQTSSMIVSYKLVNSTYADFNGPCPAGQTAGKTKCESTPSTSTIDMYNNLIRALNIFLGVLSMMISPIIMFAGWLMSPDWTSGDVFALRPTMYKLWAVISSMVYIIYAILLILIALGTMFNNNTFSYKVMLPKLALGILMVPFTWWFVQWTISISSVMTRTVMSIPMDNVGESKSTWFTKPSIPTDVLISTIGSGATSKSDCSGSSSINECISPETFLKTSGGMFSPLIVYGYSIFKFKEIATIESGPDYAKAAIELVHTTIVSSIMFLVFGLLTLALISILMVRAIKLWMYAIFSPLFTFRFVAGSNMLGGDDDSFTIKEFVGLAFVPAVVSLTLSFGLIIINAVQGPGANGVNPNASSATTCDLNPGAGVPCKMDGIFGDPSNTITRTIEAYGQPEAYSKTVITYGGITFRFLGKAINQTDTKSTTSGPISSIGGIFGTIIVDVIALVFIWMAFMAAKTVSKAVKLAVEPFEKIGSQVGSLAKSIPKYTPLPLPGGSISGMGKVADGLARIPEVKANERFENSGVGKWIKDQTGGASVAETQKLREAIVNHPELLKETVKMGGPAFRQDGVKELVKHEEELKKNISSPDAKYGTNEQNRILELVAKAKKEGGLDENYAAILQAVMSGAKSNIDAPEAKKIVEGFKTGTSTTGGANGGNGVTGIKVNEKNGSVTNITINNNGEKIWEINNLTPSNIDKFAKDLKGSGITEERLKEVLKGTQLSGNATDILEKIKKLEETPTSGGGGGV